MHITPIKSSSRLSIDAIHLNGFSLIELLIVISIIGITSSLGIPAFNGWVSNAKTRTFAEALQNNIRLTQAEAVRTGRQVQFFLTDSTPSLISPASVSGKNWGIRTMSLTNSTTADQFIQGGSMSAGNDLINILSSSDTLQFNSIGRLTTPAQSAEIQISNTNGNRPLRVTVSAAGAIRMCDPSKSITEAPDGC